VKTTFSNEGFIMLEGGRKEDAMALVTIKWFKSPSIKDKLGHGVVQLTGLVGRCLRKLWLRSQTKEEIP